MHTALLATLTIRETCRRELRKVLVAGGGFVPQSLIESSELIDSTMVRNAENGYKGKLFIQFSFRITRAAVLRSASKTLSGSTETQIFAPHHKDLRDDIEGAISDALGSNRRTAAHVRTDSVIGSP